MSPLNFDQSFVQPNAKKQIYTKKSSRFEFKCGIIRTEPTHSLTLMNNGKVFSSLDCMACSYQCSDQFQYLPGH